MKRKKTVKQLMAIGVQRNDAAAFARTYRNSDRWHVNAVHRNG